LGLTALILFGEALHKAKTATAVCRFNIRKLLGINCLILFGEALHNAETATAVCRFNIRKLLGINCVDPFWGSFAQSQNRKFNLQIILKFPGINCVDPFEEALHKAKIATPICKFNISRSLGLTALILLGKPCTKPKSLLQFVDLIFGSSWD